MILIPRLTRCCANIEFGLIGLEPPPSAPIRVLPVPLRARGLSGDSAPVPRLLICAVIGMALGWGGCASPVTRLLEDGLLPPEPLGTE